MSHSFINVDELPPGGMPKAQLMSLMVVEQWKDRSVFGGGEESQAVARKADGYCKQLEERGRLVYDV